MSFGLPNVREAKDLPDLREWMLRYWREDGPFDWMPDARAIRRELATSPLWWVTTEMCDLLAASAETYPNDDVLDMTTVANVAGFAVFEDDLEGIDADPAHNDLHLDGKVRVSAVLWGPSNLPPINGETRPGISFSLFCRVHLSDGMDERDLARSAGHMAALAHHHPEESGKPLSGSLFVYLGRTDWLHGWAVDAIIPDNPHGDNPITLASMAEDRRLMASLWNLVNTPITKSTPARIPRPIVRRAERKRLDPNVRVITLRHYESDPNAAPSVSHRREWKHQWVVRPHWCWQPYGPGSKKRKLILRGPFTKGPGDKPLIGGERVWKVVPPK